MSHTADLLISDPSPGLRVIRINRPEHKNALNLAAHVQLRQALEEASADDSVSVIALTGVGKYFSSGNDMAHVASAEIDASILEDSIDILRRLVHLLVRCPKLLVAVVNGPAIGPAAALVALCDVVYVAESAYFLTPFVALGVTPECCASYTFPRILGPSKAAEMLLLNHRMSAREAYEFGFAAEVFGDEELGTKLWPRIERLAGRTVAHQSVRATKQLMRHQNEQELLGACEQELMVLRGFMQSTKECSAVRQFVETRRKRKHATAVNAKL